MKINNYGYEDQDNYIVNLKKGDGELLATALGNPVSAGQTLIQTLM